jgi:AcrR family transcriptional regulator
MGNGKALLTADADTDETKNRDGRHARRDRNSEAVIEAVLAFLSEGEGHPTAQQVADRSGVSLRSVFRYFDDMDALICAAVATQIERFGPFIAWKPPAPSFPLADRLEYLVRQRMYQFQNIAVEYRAAIARAHRHAGVYNLVEGNRRRVRLELSETFAPELRTLAEGEQLLLLGALQNATMFEAYESLRDRYDMTPEQIADTMRLSVRRLFADFL